MYYIIYIYVILTLCSDKYYDTNYFDKNFNYLKIVLIRVILIKCHVKKYKICKF